MNPPKERIKFYEENKEEIIKICQRENAKRDDLGYDRLDEREVDTVIAEMHKLVQKGQSIDAFEFPSLMPDLPAVPPRTRHNKHAPEPEKYLDGMQFNIQACANGFLMTIKSHSQSQSPFIFRNLRELTAILKNQFFPDTHEKVQAPKKEKKEKLKVAQ